MRLSKTALAAVDRVAHTALAGETTIDIPVAAPRRVFAAVTHRMEEFGGQPHPQSVCLWVFPNGSVERVVSSEG